jgi:hypothetical protein
MRRIVTMTSFSMERTIQISMDTIIGLGGRWIVSMRG